ncbi:glycosyltransferase family 4 protein [Kordiimonas aquimaris]|uniref:glycosyltransferase family 4 protein n=1 Tax=Kordiimonas aquimaris TaxID=707591 RepID=UPI0021D2AA60|nr:glycosyltransferase family 4 protein [Kordiimonas aquimaris]
MNKPKVLHVFPSFEVGGSQRRLVGYLNQTTASLDHYIYAMDGNYGASNAVKNFNKAPFPEKAIPKNNIRSAIGTCRSHLKAFNPDLLVSYNWGSIEWNIANIGKNVCPMMHIQDGFADDEHSGEKLTRRLMRQFMYKRCNAVVVPSNQLAQLAKTSWGIKINKLHYIPNGIDVNAFNHTKDLSLLAPHGVKDKHVIIGTIARLKPEKNIGRLIETFSLIENDFPEAKLVIVGDGIGMAALKMLAERICVQENVIFTGALETPENIVPAFDIFALSSDTEQMPISVLEAMAAGKPVVSTDVGDVRAMVAQDNAELVSGVDAGILAENIAALLNDAPRRLSLGNANQTLTRERYSLESMIQAYDDLFMSLTN